MKALFVLMFVSSAALADDAALLRCRQLADGPARLACYNAIPVGAVAPAAAAVPAAVSAKAEQERMFGRETQVVKAQQLEQIETTIAGAFDGWVAGQRIRLANGQVWKVVDGSDDVVDLHDPKVIVKRGLLGAIFLDIEGAHRNPKVQRVQ